MAQFSRPDNDDAIGSYTDDGGGTTNIFQAIDEVTQDDNDWVEAVIGGTPLVYDAGASVVTDPLVSTGHTLRWVYRKSAAAGRDIEAKMELRVGTTVVVTRTFSAISETFTLDAHPLTAGEADAITDYGNLNFRITGTRSGSGAGRELNVSWVELEVPDAAGGFAHVQVQVIG